MPIKKFKSFDEARKDLWVSNPDSEYFRKLRDLFIAVERLSPRKVKRGIQKFRTIEELNDFKQK